MAPSTTDHKVAVVPEVISQGSSGMNAPTPNTTNDAAAACSGLPVCSGSMPSSSRAWVSRARSGSRIIFDRELVGHPESIPRLS